jgi:hypothetical protein
MPLEANPLDANPLEAIPGVWLPPVLLLPMPGVDLEFGNSRISSLAIIEELTF